MTGVDEVIVNTVQLILEVFLGRDIEQTTQVLFLQY